MFKKDSISSKQYCRHLMALCEGFEKITKVFDNKDGDNEIVALFKLIREKLYIKDSNTGNRNMIRT